MNTTMQGSEMFAHARHAPQMRVDCGRIVLKPISSEEIITQRDKIVEPTHARPQQFEDSKKPGVPIAEERLVPYARRLEERTDTHREFCRRETRERYSLYKL